MTPLVDELRRLSVVLPPNFRVHSGEVADVLSALITHAEHGSDVLDAAREGPQAVADFFHKHISDNRPEGAPEPERGAPVVNVPPVATGGTTGENVTRAEFAQVLSALQQLTAHLASQSQTGPTVDAPEAAAPAAPPEPPASPPTPPETAAPPEPPASPPPPPETGD